MHRLIASPFLSDYLLLHPGHPSGVRIPEARYNELRARTGPDAAPVWLHDAARQAWGLTLDRPLTADLLVRERSRYGYAKASWEINLGCDYDCEFCYLGEKRFKGLDWQGKQQLLRTMRDSRRPVATDHGRRGPHRPRIRRGLRIRPPAGHDGAGLLERLVPTESSDP